MSRPAASPDLTNVASGVLTIDVAVASAAGSSVATPPDWIKLGPRGAFSCRDGRKFSFDPEALAARFASEGVDIPLDLDHGIVQDRPGAVAQGWIKRLEARADGLYGQVDWLEGGRAALKARTHRYVSPTFHTDDQGAATWVHSVSLVPAPALPGAALASAGAPTRFDKPETASMKAIAQALGLNPDANEQACLSALTSLKDGRVDKAVHETTLASLSAAKTELESVRKAARDKEVAELIDGALKAKKILPAEKDSFVTLCASDDGLAQVRKLIDARPAQLAASGLDGRAAPAGGLGEQEFNPVSLAAKAQALVAESAAYGVTLSIADAVAKVKAEGSR
ncbi:phage protease [Methylopila sp. M107]|uniref:phage protease n=1 Tax=Methylopila sp. M107 TaxID=1101190 RepID=UPI00037ECE37|nr:phage protease [Methylopila sp. M107]